VNSSKGVPDTLPEVHASPSLAPYIDPRQPYLKKEALFRLGTFTARGSVKDPLHDVHPFQLEQVLQA
jgi:hypothetical protein